MIRIRHADGRREIWLADRHAVYRRGMEYQFEYYFGSVKPKAYDDRIVADFSRPALHTLIGLDFPMATPAFLEPVRSAAHYVKLLDVQPGETVWDLGANVGVGAILFAQAVGDAGHVVAVDPDRESEWYFHRNIIEWQLERRSTATIEHLAAAIDDDPGHCGVMFSGDGALGAGLTDLIGQRGTSYAVPACDFVDIARVSGTVPSHIKVDIEGAELSMVRNARNRWFLQRHRPRMVIEPHKVGIEMDTSRVRDELASLGGYDVEIVHCAGDPYDLIVARPKESAR